MVKISAILLGAGESKRMGLDKLMLPWGKKTLLEHCLVTLLKSKVREVIIVLGLRSREKEYQLEKRFPLTGKKIKMVINPDYRRGMSTSIRRGIQAMDPRSHGILIALGDQPFLKTRTINALIQAFSERKGDIIVPSFCGRRGHPVIFDCKYKEKLLRLKGDVGGRSVIQKYSNSVIEIRVRSEGVVKDIDTREDYQKLKETKGRRIFR